MTAATAETKATISTATIGLESITLEQIRSAIVELIAAHPADAARIQRGARLLATHSPESVDGVRGVWIAPSEETPGAFYVVMQGPTVKADGCSCPDHKNRRALCKHIWLVRVWQAACASCDEPATQVSGNVPFCDPCSERNSDPTPQLYVCRGCGRPTEKLSFGKCSTCCRAECFND